MRLSCHYLQSIYSVFTLFRWLDAIGLVSGTYFSSCHVLIVVHTRDTCHHISTISGYTPPPHQLWHRAAVKVVMAVFSARQLTALSSPRHQAGQGRWQRMRNLKCIVGLCLVSSTLVPLDDVKWASSSRPSAGIRFHQPSGSPSSHFYTAASHSAASPLLVLGKRMTCSTERGSSGQQPGGATLLSSCCSEPPVLRRATGAEDTDIGNRGAEDTERRRVQRDWISLQSWAAVCPCLSPSRQLIKNKILISSPTTSSTNSTILATQCHITNQSYLCIG